MLVKALLVTTIAEILAERGYTQTKAAALLGNSAAQAVKRCYAGNSVASPNAS